ncbi:hypothetical protein IQ07DRAFT_590708 [Pyrenochaeta sp. DS3sAY3a]|nr:hypothetical protein IQ07DRAFT_590708 [Pyrenochaeta sp. DS3sAY3a]
MRASSFFAPLFLAATVAAQAVEEGIAPDTPPPAGCETNVDGNFTIGTLKIEHKSKRETAQEAADGALFCTLKNGILKDQYGRIGSVVANRQFQFDGPPQAGAIYTGGFSVCANNSLAIGGTTRWWQCSSGPFYNLYDEWIGGQCEEIRIQVGLLSEPSSSTSTSSPSSAPLVSGSTSVLSGPISTLSATESGLATSRSGSGTVASTASRGSLAPSGSPTGGSASSSSSATAPAAAPPADTGLASSIDASRGAFLAVLFGLFGIAFGI